MATVTRATGFMEEPLSVPLPSTPQLQQLGLPTTQSAAQTVPASSVAETVVISPPDLIKALAQLQDAIYQFKKAGGQWREPQLRGAAMTMACRVPGHKVFIDGSGNFTFDGVSVTAPRQE